jgi:hypothetical protein
VSSISRRSFLLGAAALAGSAACGSKSKPAAIKVPGPTTSAAVQGPTTSPANQLNLLETSGPNFLAGLDQRMAFVLRGQSDFIALQGPVTLQFGPDQAHLGPALPTQAHADAGTAPNYVTLTYRFDHPGTWWSRATYQGRTADAPFTVIEPGQSQIPYAGQPMISTPTPTMANHAGVNPICTRNPVCPWHDTSLDAALAQHKPLAVLFATPALCQTATCGPVLDQLLSLRSALEPKVRFLHVEIYTDMTAQTNAPAVVAYHLESEPVLFLAGADGTVKQRIDGLFGHGEVSAAVQAIAG